MAFLSIEPLDVFCGRGNKLFGEPGSFGSVGMPPWPSVFAGAIRSRILVDQQISPVDLLLGNVSGKIAYSLGNGVQTGQILESGDPEYAIRAGSFRITWVSLLKGSHPIFPAPSDVIGLEGSDGRRQDATETSKFPLVSPEDSPEHISSSYPLSMPPIFKESRMGKPKRDYWIEGEALKAYLAGEPIGEKDVLPEDVLWTVEERVGIGMDPAARTVETGKLFTTEAVRLLPGVSFLVGVEGADELLPRDGLLRLGGDGRGALFRPSDATEPPMHADLDDVAKTGRFKLVLCTPGLFPNGWLLFGVSPEDFTLKWSAGGKSMSAKLVGASIGRCEVVSGWDLAREQPKKAQRIVPAGGVYWFKEAEGDVASVLERVAKGGLWEVAGDLWEGGTNEESVLLWRERRSEGFNNVLVGLWTKE
jgi:CRISPR-associated protein Cmr3